MVDTDSGDYQNIVRYPKPLADAPARLRLLADFLDAAIPGDPNPEVQFDLRHWAKTIEILIPALEHSGECGCECHAG